MKQVITISLLLINYIIFSQIGEVPTVLYKGIKCYEHTVKKKQTAYGISRMYKADINTLYEYNPLASKGLKIGQKVYLPLSGDKQTHIKGESIQQEGLKSNETQIKHTVKEGETLWSVARKYGVNPKDVADANIEKGNKLNIGDEIIIPISEAVKKDETSPIIDIPKNPLESLEDSIILHKVIKGETLYGISTKYGITQQAILSTNKELDKGLKKGMNIRIPLKRKVILKTKEILTEKDSNNIDTSINIIETKYKETYDVAIMLPFELDENTKKMSNCPPYGDCPIQLNTIRSLNFYRGMMMAIDSLQQAGMNMNIRVYDTKSNEEEVHNILAKEEFKAIDMILGPLYVKELKIVSKYAKENKIQMICPVPVSNKALYQNPYISKLTASKYTQVEYLAKYLAENNNNDNIILVRNKQNNIDEIYFKLFKKTYSDEVLKYPTRTSDSVKIAIGVGNSSKLIYVQKHMQQDIKNIIVDLSTDLGHISNLITKLTSTMNSHPYNRYDISLYGMEDWRNFETIDEKYKNRYNLNIIAPGFLDFKTQKSKLYIKKYREKYGTDPDKFSFVGFDAAFTNLKGLYLYGTEYSKQYDKIQTEGYYNKSIYKKAEEGSGFENKDVSIIKYNNYKLERIN